MALKIWIVEVLSLDSEILHLHQFSWFSSSEKIREGYYEWKEWLREQLNKSLIVVQLNVKAKR